MGFIGSLNTGGEPSEACKLFSHSISVCPVSRWRVALILIAFVTAAKADAPKPSALQKSKAAIGLRATDSAGKKEKSNENSSKIAEVSRTKHGI